MSEQPSSNVRVAYCDESNGWAVHRGDIHVATFQFEQDARDYALPVEPAAQSSNERLIDALVDAARDESTDYFAMSYALKCAETDRRRARTRDARAAVLAAMHADEPPVPSSNQRRYPPKHSAEVNAVVSELIKVAAELARGIADEPVIPDTAARYVRERAAKAVDDANERAKVIALRIRYAVDKLPSTDEPPVIHDRPISASQRLHNICDALTEQADDSPFTREEWERVDKQTVELQNRVRQLEHDLADAREAFLNQSARLVQAERISEPPTETERKDWQIVSLALMEARQRLQEGGTRHSWIDAACDIAHARSAVTKREFPQRICEHVPPGFACELCNHDGVPVEKEGCP